LLQIGIEIINVKKDAMKMFCDTIQAEKETSCHYKNSLELDSQDQNDNNQIHLTLNTLVLIVIAYCCIKSSLRTLNSQLPLEDLKVDF